MHTATNLLGLMQNLTAFMRTHHSFLWLVVAILFISASSSYSLSYFTLYLEERHWSASRIGFGHAVQMGAVLMSAILFPRLLRHLNVMRGMWASNLACILLLYLFFFAGDWLLSPALFFIYRFLFGLGIALSYMFGESWLNALAPNDKRGMLLGLYSAIIAIGLGLGPMPLPLFDINSIEALFLPTGMMAITGVILFYLRRFIVSQRPVSIKRCLRIMWRYPAAMVAAIIFGVMDACLYTVIPLYGIENALSKPHAISLVLVGNIGAILLQLPLGWLADRMMKRMLLTICTFVTALSIGVVPWLLGSPALLAIAIFFWGGFFSMLYVLPMVMYSNLLPKNSLTAAITIVILMYGVGSLVGPAVTGIAIDLDVRYGLPLLLGIICLLSIITVWCFPKPDPIRNPGRV